MLAQLARVTAPPTSPGLRHERTVRLGYRSRQATSRTLRQSRMDTGSAEPPVSSAKQSRYLPYRASRGVP